MCGAFGLGRPGEIVPTTLRYLLGASFLFPVALAAAGQKFCDQTVAFVITSLYSDYTVNVCCGIHRM